MGASHSKVSPEIESSHSQEETTREIMIGWTASPLSKTPPGFTQPPAENGWYLSQIQEVTLNILVQIPEPTQEILRSVRDYQTRTIQLLGIYSNPQPFGENGRLFDKVLLAYEQNLQDFLKV